jgi:hypothetical protein
MEDEQHFRMPGDSENYEHEGDEIDKCDTIPTVSQQARAATKRKRLNSGTSDIDLYEGGDGDDVDADDEEETSPADDGSTQNWKD